MPNAQKARKESETLFPEADITSTRDEVRGRAMASNHIDQIEQADHTNQMMRRPLSGLGTKQRGRGKKRVGRNSITQRRELC